MSVETEARQATSQGRRSLTQDLHLLMRYRELLVSWTSREIRARYRQSVLGIGWALVQPVVSMVVVSIIFGNVVRVPSEGIPYPVFAYVAILPWTLFSGSSITTSDVRGSKIAKSSESA